MAFKIVSLVVLLLTIALVSVSDALRTGAPSLACMNLRPFHGLHSAKPASASQFYVTQSSLTYAPGQNVTVEISTQSDERYFRGFLVQAYDPITGSNIGRFLPTNQVRPLDCSAATHRENLNKKQVTLTWIPPVFSDAASSDQSPSVTSQWLGLRAPQLSQSSHATVGNSTAISVLHPSNAVRQVRFRATIVVTYDDFYTGFESSDQKFDKFDYAPVSPSAATA